MIYVALFIVVVVCCVIAGHGSEMEDEARRQTKEAKRQAQVAERQAGEMQRLATLEQTRSAERKQQLEQEARRRALAKRPEAFVTLFGEEFPGYAGDITYGRAEQILALFEALSRSDLIVERLAASGGDDGLLLVDATVQQWFARRIAPIVSQEFTGYARSCPEEFMSGLARAVRSSATIAGVDR